MNKKTLVIAVEYKNHTSFFYYPSISCKTKDGEMKMLLKQLEESKEPYKLECSYNHKGKS